MKTFSVHARSSLRLAAILCYAGFGVAGFAQNQLSGVVAGSLPDVGLGLSYAGPVAPSNLGSFGITIVPGSGLSGNAPALAAFQRAANQWAAFIADPITVTIDADLANLGNPSIIGSTSAVFLQASYNTIRNQMVADAADEASNGVVAALPTAAQFSAFAPNGVSLANAIVATKANLKAMGFAGLDGSFGASDGAITFNSTFTFDYDNSDGVTAGTMDFETVAAHEIGHALGFVSTVDSIDGGATTVGLMPWDLFRFDTANNPSTLADITTFPRNLVPGSTALFDELSMEALVSTGVASGDGRQASHWKDDSLTGNYLGIMDPTLAFGVTEAITPLDLRLLDVIGYEIPAQVQTEVPEASTNAALLGAALLTGTWLSRRRAQRK